MRSETSKIFGSIFAPNVISAPVDAKCDDIVADGILAAELLHSSSDITTVIVIHNCSINTHTHTARAHTLPRMIIPMNGGVKHRQTDAEGISSL